MKKFMSGVKKNIFYISLITGMAVLVTVLGLYNAQNKSKDNRIVIGQNEPYENTSEQGAKETLSDKKEEESTHGKDVDTADNTDSAADDTDSAAEDSISEENADNGDSSHDITGQTAETGATGEALHYDPVNSISWPLTGNVIIPYSMDTTVYFETLKEYKCSPAMVIEAQKGDEVKAVYESKVAEVSSNSELGNYVKLELGDGYTVTLGQLQDVKVALGEHMEAGQVVGTIGEPSRFYSEEGSNLYFAVEKDGDPVDPMLLIQ